MIHITHQYLHTSGERSAEIKCSSKSADTLVKVECKYGVTNNINVTLDHKTSHKGKFFEIEIYTSTESWINKLSIDV